jgi:hypothetical protein
MHIFTCSACQQTVFFENVQCTSCSRPLAYLPDLRIMSALEPHEPSTIDSGSQEKHRSPGVAKSDAPRAATATRRSQLFVALAPPARGGLYRSCRNAIEYGNCNWTVPASESHAYCWACRLTSLSPDLDQPEAVERWHKLERAKRRLLYTLDQLGLPIESRAERPKNGLAFVFLAQGDLGREIVLTGHANGIVTINVNEADDPYREQVRKEMGEAYRTLLGHVRHEVGHYYWDRLVRDTPWHSPFRALFGDERLDYAAAATRHYQRGAPSDWQRSYVSAYATMHPWEDWAETWSHYLHMFDTLDTARAYSLVVQPRPTGGEPGWELCVRALELKDASSVINAWVALTTALNSLNRSMGLSDPYPFVLSERAVLKLRFVHDVVEHWSKHDQLDEVIARWPAWVEAPAPLIATATDASGAKEQSAATTDDAALEPRTDEASPREADQRTTIAQKERSTREAQVAALGTEPNPGEPVPRETLLDARDTLSDAREPRKDLRDTLPDVSPPGESASNTD